MDELKTHPLRLLAIAVLAFGAFTGAYAYGSVNTAQAEPSRAPAATASAQPAEAVQPEVVPAVSAGPDSNEPSTPQVGPNESTPRANSSAPRAEKAEPQAAPADEPEPAEETSAPEPEPTPTVVQPSTCRPRVANCDH